MALYALTDGLGIYYLVSAILASQVSTLNNFVLTELWVFADRDHRSHVLFRYVVFNLLNIATLAIRVPVLFILTDLCQLSPDDAVDSAVRTARTVTRAAIESCAQRAPGTVQPCGSNKGGRRSWNSTRASPPFASRSV